MEIKERVGKLLGYISEGLIEKDLPVKLALLASISGESIFFLGPPGTAKSMVSRSIAKAFKGEGQNKISYFEYLMNQFSTPDELFGPVSIPALEKEEYKRITKNYLPEAEVAFLDEIWKAGPAIQNTLLTIINEKKFHNGNQVMEVPLRALISASNELPAENLGLEALWDRFLIRLVVNPVSEENFFSVVDAPTSKEEAPVSEEILNSLLTAAELSQWQKSIDEVKLTDEVKSVITAIRKELTVLNAKENRDPKELFYISDRRWKKIVHIIKTSAFINGRDYVDLMDCHLIKYCLWSTQNQISEAAEVVKNCIKQYGIKINSSIDDINSMIMNFEKNVEARFYVKKAPTAMLYKMNDKSLAYKLTSSANINSYRNCKVDYVSFTTPNSNYSERKGAYYDSNKDFIGDYDYYVENPKLNSAGFIEFDDGYTGNSYKFQIEMKQGGMEKNKSLFENSENLMLIQNAVDNEFYTKLKNAIESNLSEFDKYIQSIEKPYVENIFKDDEIYEIVFESAKKAREEILDAQVRLEKIREKYQK